MQENDKRISIEIQKIEMYKKTNKFPKNWFYLGPTITNGVPDFSVFRFSWRGKEGHCEGGVYNARIVLQGNLKDHAPKCYIDNEFCHMHVYSHGLVCFPFIDQFKWKASITIFEIATELERMINSPPDISSPANEKMKQLYLQGEQVYFNFLKQQAIKFANNKPYEI